jgi:hypothetical protein
MFDPNDITSHEKPNSDFWKPPKNIKFEIFNIENIDKSIGPFYHWHIFDENGSPIEIMPHLY